DPSLRVHAELLPSPPRRIPTRIVLDSHGRTPPSARVLDGSIPTIIAVSEHCRRAFPAGVRVLPSGREQVEWPRLWEGLHRLGLRRVLVEGGGTVLASLLRTSPFDRFTVYVAPIIIGGATAPSLAMGTEVASEHGVVRLRLAGVERLGSGSLLDYRPMPAEAPRKVNA
ncbi:MAG: dihydrofolate reductase family protein, partial [Thermoplasmata archaeon]|nr:dihydrofolate reductase family protein [Thermoplasmata archaeon]